MLPRNGAAVTSLLPVPACNVVSSRLRQYYAASGREAWGSGFGVGARAVYTYAGFQPYARRCALIVLAAAVILPLTARRGYVATVGTGRRTRVIVDVGLPWFACERVIGNGCVAGCSIAWAEWAYLASCPSSNPCYYWRAFGAYLNLVFLL